MARWVRWGVVPLVAVLVLAATSCSLPLGDLGGPTAVAYGINEAGVIVGTSELPGSTNHVEEHAFKRRPDGTMIDLGTLPGSRRSLAFRINDSGVAVGMAEVPISGPTSSVETHAVRWDHTGAITDLGTMGGGYVEVRDLDEQGRAIGYVDGVGGRSTAFVVGPTATELTPLADLRDATSSLAFGVNDQGDAVGYQWVGGQPVPVLWDLDTGAVTDLSPAWGPGLLSDISDTGAVIGLARFSTPAGASSAEGAILRPGDPAPVSFGLGSFSLPLTINDDEVVVGYRGGTSFRWEAAGATELEPGANSWAYDINDRGQVVGGSGTQAVIFVTPLAG